MKYFRAAANVRFPDRQFVRGKIYAFSEEAEKKYLVGPIRKQFVELPKITDEEKARAFEVKVTKAPFGKK